MLSVMLKQISVLVAFAGFVSCQPKDVDGWSKVIKWGMTIEEAKAAFGSDAPGQISNVGTFLVKHVEIGSLIIDVTVWSKQHVVSSVQMNAAVPTEHLNTGRRAEMFNILNNTNLTPQFQTIFDGTGKLVGTVGTPVAPTTNSSRQIQLGLRLVF